MAIVVTVIDPEDVVGVMNNGHLDFYIIHEGKLIPVGTGEAYEHYRQNHPIL